MSFGFTTLAEYSQPVLEAGASSLWDLCTVTYEELRAKMAEQILGASPDDAAKQRLANLNSALNHFTRVLRLAPESRVGSDLGDRFRERLERVAQAMAKEGATQTRIRDCRSLMQRWAELAEILKNDSLDSVATFQKALSAAISESASTIGDIAESVGVSRQTVERWVSGGLPNVRSLPTLRRIEARLGLERDSLTTLVPTRQVRKALNPAPSSAYRVRLAERSQDTYYLPIDEFSPEMQAEWVAYLNYKTDRMPRLERQVTGEWRTRPAEKVAPSMRHWCAMTRTGRVAPTALKQFQQLRAILGFARRAKKNGLLAEDVATPESLAIFASVEVIEAYITFLVERSGDKVHGGVIEIVKAAKSMVHPITGYLTQLPQFSDKLGIAKGDWRAHCEAAIERFRKLDKTCKRNFEMSRDPWEPIRDLLALDVPISPVLEGIAQARRDLAALPRGTVARAIHVRDLLLISFLVSNPLRIQNIREMTYSADNLGNLYKAPNGTWRLRYRPESFKNVAGAAKDRPYDAEVDPALYELLETWLFEERQHLDPDGGDLVFISSRASGDTWEKPSVAVRMFGRRYVPGCMGWGPHTLRHLVATTFLKRAPGHFKQVATLLHDKLPTVMKHYAHLCPDDGLSQWRGLLDNMGRKAA